VTLKYPLDRYASVFLVEREARQTKIRAELEAHLRPKIANPPVNTAQRSFEKYAFRRDLRQSVLSNMGEPLGSGSGRFRETLYFGGDTLRRSSVKPTKTTFWQQGLPDFSPKLCRV